MPSKVSRTTPMHPPASKSTSKSSSKTSQPAPTKVTPTSKTTTPPKTKNVDKVEFNKPKPTANAGTYKPPAPHKPLATHTTLSCTAQDLLNAAKQAPDNIN